MPSLQELINKSSKIIESRDSEQERRDEIKNKINELESEYAKLDQNSSHYLSDGIYEVGQRALLENCNNCNWVDKDFKCIDIKRCNKCRYNYDSYFEEK